MFSTPHEGSAELRLCDALLGFVDGGRLDSLRQTLRGFNHRFRNLLNSLRMSFYLAKRSGFESESERWGEIDRVYKEVEQFQSKLETIYQAMPLTPINGRLGALVDEREATWGDWFRQNGAELILETPEEEREGRFDPMFLGTALDGFIAWRAASLPPGSCATLRWATDDEDFAIDWTERSAESPGSRPSAPAHSGSGSLSETTASLSLPLLARVIAEHGGRLSWSREPEIKARVRWPLTAPARGTVKRFTTPT